MLYHGTGARRVYSLNSKGLQPGPKDVFVYASPNPVIAGMIAATRAFEEGDYGLIVSFEKKGTWETDEKFPNSVKHYGTIPSSELMFSTLIPETEFNLIKKLRGLAITIGVRLQ